MILFDIFQDVFVALAGIAGGYLAAFAVFLLLSYCMAFEGRGLLMSGSSMSRIYYLQVGLCYAIASATGVLVALRIFPEMPMSATSVSSVAFLLCLAVVRLRSRAPNQQSIADTALLVLCVLVGSGVPTMLHVA